MATLLTGKPVVERMAQGLAPRIDALVQAGVMPTLALVRVGERPDDLSYERTAVKRAEALGIAVRRTMLDDAGAAGSAGGGAHRTELRS